MSGAETLAQALHEQRHLESASVVFGTSERRRTLTYPRLAEEIAAVGGGFLHQGVRPADRVMIRLGSSKDGVLALLGLLHIGAVPVSVKPRVPGAVVERYLAEVARQQGVRQAFRVAGPGLRELDLVRRPGLVDGPAPGHPDEPAFVQYTSGSTGMPRPIPLSYRAVLGTMEAIRTVAGMRPGHVGLIVVPLHHDMGLVGMLSSLQAGKNLIVEDSGVFLRRPMAALRLLRDAERVNSALPDFMLRYLTARIGEVAARGPVDPELFGAWRTVFCGAEPIRRTTVDSFLAAARPWGFDPSALVFSYGLAEAALLATSHRYTDSAGSFHQDGPAATACLGEPIPGLGLRITGAGGAECAEGEIGAVELRGPTLFDGYDGVTDHRTAWFDTGDLGTLRQGRLHPNGRRGDRFTVNGVNLFATDIEQVASEVERVAECVVLPSGDSFAVLVVPERAGRPDTGRIADRITADVGVSPHTVLTVAHSAIARTASGKPARTHMADQFEKGLLR